MRTVLRAECLALGYGGGAVLEGVDLEVHAGEFWLLLGPNGAGKTTLVRAILGALRPRSGRLELDPELARRDRIGFVPQRCDLQRTMPTTVREFVGLGLVGVRSAFAERGSRLSWALERVGLGGMERRDYWSLSGGQRQRALVARALIRRPRVVILDEPTAGLDLPARESLLRSVTDLGREEGTTVLFVTHDLTSAVHHASHAALFAGGRVVAGPGGSVLTSANLERAYGVPVTVSGGPEGPTAISIHSPDER